MMETVVVLNCILKDETILIEKICYTNMKSDEWMI